MTDGNGTGRRSQEWFGGRGAQGFTHRSWVRSRGVPTDHFDGRPIIGICNTWSELTSCNSHFRELAQHVREGVLEAGGVPMEFPVISTGETLTRPTAMLLRNLCSMDVEETLRANPLDGVVLMMGCDKTTPGLLMGAASVNLPTVGLSGGPMLNGSFRGKPFGIKDAWKLSADLRAGRATAEDAEEAESCLNRTVGVCNVMGTGSTMAAMVEAMGVGLPDNAAIPGVDARRRVLARMVGRRIVDMVREDLTFKAHSGIAILRGNPCPDGAVIKPSAAEPRLLKHTGRAVVFEDQDDLNRRVDDPDLEIDADSVMVLKNCGPKGFPGMPELGMMPIPAKLLSQGVTDMVRISDARMSGTSFGAVVLHVSPEAAAGGVLGVVRTGDLIELDVAGRRLELLVPDEELHERLDAQRAPEPKATRGYAKLYVDTVNQAHDGCDLDFLVGRSGSDVPPNQH